MKSGPYIEVISLVERLHRHFLEIIKLELESSNIHDINNAQALMLFNIGDAEITVSELTARGYYLGTNVSYNVKKMVENGYLAAERSAHDLRSYRVKLTKRGHILRDRLSVMHRRHIARLARRGVTESDLKSAMAVLDRLERFWVEVRNPYRRP